MLGGDTGRISISGSICAGYLLNSTAQARFGPYATRLCGDAFWQASLHQMLLQLGMSFHGRQHSGMDDARNICRIVERMAADACVLTLNDGLDISVCNLNAILMRRSGVLLCCMQVPELFNYTDWAGPGLARRQPSLDNLAGILWGFVLWLTCDCRCGAAVHRRACSRWFNGASM